MSQQLHLLSSSRYACKYDEKHLQSEGEGQVLNWRVRERTTTTKLFGYLFPFFVKCWWQFYFCLRNKDNKTLYLTETFKWTQSQTYCRDSHTDHTAGRHQRDEDLDDLHSWWSQHTKMTQKEADSKQRLGVTWTLFTKTWFKRERQILINMGRGLYTRLIQEYEHKNYEHEWRAIYKCVT